MGKNFDFTYCVFGAKVQQEISVVLAGIFRT